VYDLNCLKRRKKGKLLPKGLKETCVGKAWYCQASSRLVWPSMVSDGASGTVSNVYSSLNYSYFLTK